MEPLAELVAALVDGRAAPAAPIADVRRHRLAPLAYRAGRSEFRADYVTSSLRAEQQRAIAAEAVAALTRAAVPTALLKGVSYAGWLYDDPGERPMTDVDLLVPIEAFDDAVRVLYRLGYWHAGKGGQRSPRHHAMTLKRRNASIDLHRSPIQLGRTAIDLASVWHRASAAAWVPGALRLETTDELLFLVANLVRHELKAPLISYVDAGRLLRLADRTAAVERATQWRFRRAFLACLAAIEGVLGWRRNGPWWLPSQTEVIRFQLPTRPVQLLRKLLLIEGPRELAGLAITLLDEVRASQSKP